MNDAGHTLGFLRDRPGAGSFCPRRSGRLRPARPGGAPGCPRRGRKRALAPAPADLRIAPLTRLLIWIAGIAIVVPVLVEPSFEDVVALVATVGLTLAFAVKDYVSCLIASV